MASFVKQGDAAFTTSGTWTTGSGALGYGGVYAYIAPGSGGYANFQFTGLTAGNYYRLAPFIYYGQSGDATNAAWQILDSDGSTVLASGTYNLATGAISSSELVTDQGFHWSTMCDGVRPTSTSLNFRVLQNASLYVIVNAVRLDGGIAGQLSVTSQSSSSIGLSFTLSPSVVGSVAANGYQLQRAPDSNQSPGSFSNVGSAQGTTTWTDSTVSANGRYWYRVAVTFTNGQTMYSTAADQVSFNYAGAASGPTGEVRFRGVPYAFQESFNNDGVNYGPGAANDDNYATGFSNQVTASTGILYMDFGTAVTLTAVRCTASLNEENQPSGGTFGIGSSLSGSFTTIYTIGSNNLTAYSVNEFSVSPGSSSRYGNISWTANASQYAGVAEFGFAGTYATGVFESECLPPTCSPPGGSYSTSQTVMLSCRTTNAMIYYTTDGTTPSVIDDVAQGTTAKYTVPFTVSGAATVQAIACHPACFNSIPSIKYGFFNNAIPFESSTWGSTTDGQPLQFHDGATVLFDQGYYWRVGEDIRHGPTTIYNTGIKLYRSSDLMNWKDMGLLVTTAQVAAVDSNVTWVGSAGLVKNAANNNYVIWANTANAAATYQKLAVFKSSSITSGWSIQSTAVLPGGATVAGDVCPFVDGSNGYLFYTDGSSGHIVKVISLASDFLSVTGSATTINSGPAEAPTPFKVGSTYHCFTSATAGWGASITTEQTASSVLGTWTNTGLNPFQTSGSANNALSYGSQCRCVIKSQVGQYIYLGDAWNATLPLSTFLMLPIATGSSSSISYAASFTPTQAGLSESPSSGSTGTTITLTMTGTNTSWTSQTPSGLFTVTGGSGASLGTPTITTDTSATVSLTVGSAIGTLTICDMSTGATATFTASAAAGGTGGTGLGMGLGLGLLKDGPCELCVDGTLGKYCLRCGKRRKGRWMRLINVLLALILPLLGGAATQPADDAPAIAAILNRGQPVTLQRGRIYNWASMVHVENTCVNIDFNGAYVKASPTLTVANSSGDLFQFLNCGPVLITGFGTVDQNRRQRGIGPDTVAFRFMGCKYVTVKGPTFLDAPQDGIRVTASNPADATTVSQAVRVTGCTFDGCFRNLISVIDAAYVRIDHNWFLHADGGSMPNAGIDIEPNVGDAQGATHDVTVEYNHFASCNWGACTQNGAVLGVHDINFSHNTLGGSLKYGLATDSPFTTIRDNDGPSTWISAGSGADQCIITGNNVQFIYADLVHVTNPVGHAISGNVAPAGIDVHYCYGHVALGPNVGPIKQ